MLNTANFSSSAERHSAGFYVILPVRHIQADGEGWLLSRLLWQAVCFKISDDHIVQEVGHIAR